MLKSKATSHCKIGIVGFGSIGQKHTSLLLEKFPNVNVLVVTSQRNPSNFRTHKNLTFCNSLEHLADFEPDFCIIARSAGERLELTQNLQLPRTTILFEKPVASRLSDAFAIREIFENSKYGAYIAYNLRFCKAITYVNELITEDAIGKLLAVHCSVGQDLVQWRPDRDVNETVSLSKKDGGGVLRELSHELDYLYFLLGPCELIGGLLGKQKYTNSEVEDTAMVHLVYKRGSSQIATSVNLDFIRKDPFRLCQFIGEKGTVKWDLLRGEVVLTNDLADEQVLFSDAADVSKSYQKMFESLISGEVEKFSTINDAIEHLSVIEEIESKSGRLNV